MAIPQHTFQFAGKASYPKNSIALIYDLEGFSKFFNQPDVQEYVPIFLNQVSDSVGRCLFGGNAYWMDEATDMTTLEIQVVHEKFMGDGGLYVILPKVGETDFNATQLSLLCNRLWNLKKYFNNVVKKALTTVPVVEVPRRIRFGLSRGSVYELRKPKTTSREYIGFCLNQASRLQSYCPDLGFIASARIRLSDTELKTHGYKKVVATKIKGFPRELVIVDSAEYSKLPKETREMLFADHE